MSGGVSPLAMLRELNRAGVVTAGALADFAGIAGTRGTNLAALLAFAARRGGPGAGLVDDGSKVSFAALAGECDRMAALLRDTHGVRRGDAVGVLGRNGAATVRAIFSAGRLGAKVNLLNPDMAGPQLRALIEQRRLTLVLTGTGAESLVGGAACPVLESDAVLAAAPDAFRPLGRVGGGELVVLTGGTTGPPKAARRQTDPAAFARLFAHLVTALGLYRHGAVLVAAPLFHGYGVAAFLFALALGRTVHLTPRFQAAQACALIAREQIAVAAVVPSMLQRMLAAGGDLSALRCVITGGAALAPSLAEETRRRLGDVLFNLYGTSEAGVSIFATPSDLAANPATIGREIWGVTATIRGEGDAILPAGHPGRLCIQSSAAAASKGKWVETGDVASRDEEGRLFLHGRIDEMIVSGGENVSPWEVETVLMRHPEVDEAAAVGVPDVDFGQRLIAFVAPSEGSNLTPEALGAWLAGEVARYQRPRAILFRPELPLTPVGKINKRALRAELETRPEQVGRSGA